MSVPFGSTKNFYCCRSHSEFELDNTLEVLRISTVVDRITSPHHQQALEVLRISTVVDWLRVVVGYVLWKY